MSVSSVKSVMSRISTATIESPIAVFKIKYEDGVLESVFAATLACQKKINLAGSDYVGTFSRADDLEDINRRLRVAANIDAINMPMSGPMPPTLSDVFTRNAWGQS
mgnify:CR=1 FL=1